jgi:hypothetical protein
VTIELALGDVVAGHGFLCLALRHPAVQGSETHAQVDEIAEQLGELLVAAGVMTEEALERARRVEADERPRIILARP